MEIGFPKITLQGTADRQLAVSIEMATPIGETLSFRTLIAPNPPTLPARSATAIALAACEAAQMMLDELTQFYFADAASA